MREESFRRRGLAKIAKARASMDRELLQEAGPSVSARLPEIALLDSAAFTMASSAPEAVPSNVATPAGHRRELTKAARAAREEEAFAKDRPAPERVSAIRRLSSALIGSKRLTMRLIRLLADATDELSVRVAALSVLKSASFFSRTYSSWRPTFLNALRGVAGAGSSDLVTLAYETLAQEKDGWALERLESGLRDLKIAQVPAFEAVRFLAYDDHGSHYDVLREIAGQGRNQRVRVAAIRVLAADPEARSLLLKVLQGPSEPSKVRQAALLSLRVLSPNEYAVEARRILHDDAEQTDVRAAAITALRVDAAETGAEAEQKIDELSRSAESDAVRSAANLYFGRG